MALANADHDDDFDSNEDDVVLFSRPVDSSSIVENAMDQVDRDRMYDSRSMTTMTTEYSHDVKVQKALARVSDAARHDLVPIGTARAIAKGRASYGLSQQQLATRLSMDVKKIAGIESGTAVFNADDVRRIRIFLGLKKF